MAGVPEILGTIPGWITAGGVVTGLTVLFKAHFYSRKLSIEDREALRTGFTGQVAALTKDNTDLRAELSKTRREADDDRADCHKVTDALRQLIILLREEIAGVRLNHMTRDVALMRGYVPPDPGDLSPAMKRALEQLDEVAKGRETA